MDMQEELFHIFGYVDDSSVDKNTRFFKYEDSKSVEKLNYYKVLNEKAWTLRRTQLQGKLKKRLTLNTYKKCDGGMDIVSHFKMLQNTEMFSKMTFN